MSQYPGFTFCAAAFLFCIAVGAIMNFVRRKPQESERPQEGIAPAVLSPSPEAILRPSRLEIIESRYGIDGGPDPDVYEQYLKPRIQGDALVGFVGADLFGGFQPHIGLPPKRLKVCYRFDGEESTVVRGEGEMIVLPEDRFLKKQIERYEGEKREYANRCLDYRAQLAQYASISPLQLDALALSSKLLQFIEAQGPPPQPKYTREQLDRMSSVEAERLIRAKDKDYDFACEFHYGGLESPKQGEWTAVQFATQMGARARLLDPWYGKITASYALELRDEVERMRNRLVIEGLIDDVLRVPIEGQLGREHIQAIAAKLWEFAYKLRERGIVIEKP